MFLYQTSDVSFFGCLSSPGCRFLSEEVLNLVISEHSQGFIALAISYVVYAISARMDGRLQKIIDCLKNGLFDLKCVPKHIMVADIMTNPLPERSIQLLCQEYRDVLSSGCSWYIA